jgi:hypothetical protein
MKKELQTINIGLDLDGPASWEVVKYWSDMSARFKHADIACQVMAGFTLAELRKQFSSKGARNDLNLAERSGEVGAGWQDKVKHFAGVSDDTARVWIKMSEGIRSEWKKTAPQARLKLLMSMPVNEWSDTDLKLISESVHKVADGKTQAQLQADGGGKGRRGKTAGRRNLARHPDRLRGLRADLHDVVRSRDRGAERGFGTAIKGP